MVNTLVRHNHTHAHRALRAHLVAPYRRKVCDDCNRIMWLREDETTCPACRDWWERAEEKAEAEAGQGELPLAV